jgi:hypothetical protein
MVTRTVEGLAPRRSVRGGSLGQAVANGGGQIPALIERLRAGDAEYLQTDRNAIVLHTRVTTGSVVERMRDRIPTSGSAQMPEPHVLYRTREPLQVATVDSVRYTLNLPNCGSPFVGHIARDAHVRPSIVDGANDVHESFAWHAARHCKNSRRLIWRTFRRRRTEPRGFRDRLVVKNWQLVRGAAALGVRVRDRSGVTRADASGN